MKRVQLFLALSVLLAVACQPKEMPASIASETPAPLQLTSTPSLTSSPTVLPTVTPMQTVYYVSPTGNDSNAGTIDEPWQTIQKAADTLTAGETVSIRGGTYHERILPRNSGEPGKEITYVAYPGETVTIDGDSITLPDDLAGLFEINGKSYIRISRLRVINAGPNNDNAGIMVLDASNIIIENNTTYNTNSSGIGVWGSRNVIVIGNQIEEAAVGGWQECISVAGTDTFEVNNNKVLNCHKEGICIKDGSSNGQVYRNDVHHIHAVGVYVDAWDKYTHDIAVFDNVVHDTENDGFALASEMGGLLENIRLDNNIAYNNRFIGLHITQNGDTDVHPMRNVSLINNTVVGNGVGDWGGGIAVDSNEITNVVVRNNIVSNNLSFQMVIGSDVPLEQVSIDYNLVDGFREYEGEIYGQNYIVGDPLFVDAAANDFHLQQDSPAVNAGSPTDVPNTDFDGNTRPQDGEPDVGAYEFIADIQ